MRLTLRKATIQDCDDLYRYRNDPLTREQSFNQQEILYEQHCQWFKKALEDTQRVFYIGQIDKNEKCGVVRFDLQGKFFGEINVIVSPENRGQGIGSQLISQSCRLFFTETKRKLILSRIKKGNNASIKVFQKAGFWELFQYNEVIALILLTPEGEVNE